MNKNTRPKRRNSWQLLMSVIGIALAGILAALFFISPQISGNDTPAVVLPSAAVSDAHSSDSNAPTTSNNLALVTPDTVQAVVSTLKPAGSYSRTIAIETSYNGGTSSSVISVWARGTDFRIVDVSDTYIKNILILGDKVNIWYDNRSDIYSGALDETGSAAVDEYQRILSYQQLMEIDAGAISDAGYREFNGIYCIFAEYISGAFGYKHVLHISVETGLLIGSQIWDGDRLIYSMTSAKPNISTPEDEVFKLPG